MRLLHTADWHLNDRLGGQDRTEHLRRRVERIAEICEEERVDVILVAGDLFSEQSKAEQAAESFRHLRRTFRNFFQGGGTILAVTGNHDQDGRVRPFIELARAGMDVAEPPRRPGDYFEPGKLYLLDAVFFGKLRDRAGTDLQFALLPFPSHSRLLTGSERATTAEELNRPIALRVTDWMKGLRNDARFDTALRTVLVAHMSVTGADFSRGRFTLTEQNDVVADAEDLPVGWDYVALGHVHKPQCIRGRSHVRYCGSLDRLDFSERNEEKGVVFVEIGPEGRIDEPRFIPIEATSLIEVRVTHADVTPEEVSAQLAGDDTALARVVVEPAATVASTGSLDRVLRQALPNVTGVIWQAPELDAPAAARCVEVKDTVRETVLDYLSRQPLANESHRADLLQLATQFLEQEGQR